MWFGLYVISLVASCGTFGVFIQRILASEGYAPGFNLGLSLTLGFASVFLASQLAYAACVQLFKPTRAKSFFLAESLSQAAALILAPEMLGLSIEWPIPALEKAEPLLLLAAFGLVHCFFKFMSFYAALAAKPSTRLFVVGWAGMSALAAVLSLFMLRGWVDQIRNAIPEVPGELNAYHVNNVYRQARAMPEGSVVGEDITSYPGQTLTLAWAASPEKTDPRPAPERIYVTCYLYGKETKRFTQSLKMKTSGWTEMRIPADVIPAEFESYSISWGREKEPPWQRFIPFRPVVTAPQTLLLDGPRNHEHRGLDSTPNIVVVAIDGLASGHVSYLGYNRKTTSGLDSLANAALNFPLTYAPSPEPVPAHVSLLTGHSPLKHGILGENRKPIGQDLQTLAQLLQSANYATAAFVEQVEDSPDDIPYGLGLERGFDFFDNTPPSEKIGSGATLQRARSWIDAHIESKFFAYVRLTELTEFSLQERYKPGFLPKTGEPAMVDVYDSALQYLDRHIGDFVRYIRDHDTRRNTVLVVLGTFGYEFSKDANGQPRLGLNEESLRVPLLILIPGQQKAPREDLVGLEDLYPTLLNIAKLKYSAALDGKDFLAGPTGREPVAVWTAPFALSIRTAKWRCLWIDSPMQTSDASLTTLAAGNTGYPLQLFDVSRLAKGGQYRDVASRNPAVVKVFQERIDAYARLYKDAGLAETATTASAQP